MGFCKVPFWLDMTLCCGQVFRWDKIGNWWYGVVGDGVFKVRQEGEKFEYTNQDEEFVENYFALNEDLKKIVNSINKDTHIGKALSQYWGLRIIRQDPWECLISYICATYKSIPAIKAMLAKMAKKSGKKITLDNHDFFTFPKCADLAAASEQDLKDCGLGYRAKYVLETSKKIKQNNVNLEDLRKMPYPELKKTLMEFPGVGPKVADCVMLFSLDKTEAFPVDVWVKRALLNHYREKLPNDLTQRLLSHKTLSHIDYEQLCKFGRSYFGKYAGYAQEYLYHFERMTI